MNTALIGLSQTRVLIPNDAVCFCMAEYDYYTFVTETGKIYSIENEHGDSIHREVIEGLFPYVKKAFKGWPEDWSHVCKSHLKENPEYWITYANKHRGFWNEVET